MGRKSDCEAAKLLFVYLYESCVESARSAGSAPWRPQTRRAFVSAFKVGFAHAICDRLETKRAELKAAATEHALVRIDQMERRVEEKFKELFPGARSLNNGPRAVNAEGYWAGKRYGTSIGINSTKRLKGA